MSTHHANAFRNVKTLGLGTVHVLSYKPGTWTLVSSGLPPVEFVKVTFYGRSKSTHWAVANVPGADVARTSLDSTVKAAARYLAAARAVGHALGSLTMEAK